MASTGQPVELATTHSSGVSVSEIAIQADRDEDSDAETKTAADVLDFEQPFLFSDAAIVIQGRKLHCHRVILSLYSPVFRAMFRNKCLENQKNEINLPTDSFDDIKELLNYMYTPGGTDIPAESAVRLLPIFHRYQMESMLEIAERQLAFRLTDSTAGTYIRIADLYDLQRLRQAAVDCCARMDAARLNRLFEENSVGQNLRSEILEKRVANLERCLMDIQRSFSHSCTRVESRMERVPANHCPEHNRPMTTIALAKPPSLDNGRLSNNSDPLLPQQIGCNGQGQGEGQLSNMTTTPGQSRFDVAASITPAAAAMGNLDIRPLGEGSPSRSTGQPIGSTAETSQLEACVTAVCEKCAEQLRNHIIDLCKRGMHKIPIVMCKNV